MFNRKHAMPLLTALLAAGCVSLPSGPSVLVLPGSGSSFSEFRADENACRRYAYDYIGGRSAGQADRIQSRVIFASVMMRFHKASCSTMKA